MSTFYLSILKVYWQGLVVSSAIQWYFFENKMIQAVIVKNYNVQIYI